MGGTRRTRWGGVVDWPRQTTGFFRTAQIDGVWWLVDPEGGRFLSKGVDTVKARQDRIQNSDRIPYAEACRRKYRTVEAWRAAAAQRLLAWGFNSLGAWSDEKVAAAGSSSLATAPVLHLADRYQSRESRRSRNAIFADVFDPKFEVFVRKQACKRCAPRCDDPHLIGWFSDNELRWTSDWRGNTELLISFLNLPPKRHGHMAAVEMLRQRYGSIQAFNTVWGTQIRDWKHLRAIRVEAPFTRDPPYTQVSNPPGGEADLRRLAFFEDCDAFAGLLAERYFAITVNAIKAADPSHLALGARFAYPPPREVIAAAGRHLDVISFNCYDDDPSRAISAYAALDMPCLIGEFSFRAADSGLPNTNGAGPRVATQRERAARYRDYVATAFKHDFIVGCHWFEHADQPEEGRFDGENSNFGVVTIDDEVYTDLTDAMTAFNAIAEDVHSRWALAPSPRHDVGPVLDAVTH
jgi:agarase